MATSTDKLAPRIIINEHDIPDRKTNRKNAPITLLFGFSPVGRTLEMVECNNILQIQQEFGSPSSAPEKYFIDAASKLVQNDTTVIMTRLPYDNDQSHTVKYVDYKVEEPIKMADLLTVPMETKAREKDNGAVSLLKEMHGIDDKMTQVQRITQVQDDYGTHIKSMTNEQLIELELDPKQNLDDNTFRIVDIRGEQYGSGAGKHPYTGIFPIITTAPMAMYLQEMIENSTQFDGFLQLVDVDSGIETSTDWYRNSDPVDDEVKMEQAEIVAGIKEEINFNTSSNRFHRRSSFQDQCVSRFPRVKMLEPGKLERRHLNEIGILVCKVMWDDDTQTTRFKILEAFHGKLGAAKDGIDRKINSSSKRIRMYKNLSIPAETDFFIASGQKVTSIGMDSSECGKYINYKTSIIDPITHMLEHVYSDVDSIQIDTILDAGLSSVAFAAYVAKNSSGESFKQNSSVRTRINWASGDYPIDDYIEDYAVVWNQITRLFGDFIKNVRCDCVYIADGPRILNLERNYPIRNYTDMENVEMFNKYLPLFNGYTNNYVARYWNWVYIEDMQFQNKGFWVPGSVVMGNQLAINDHSSYVWMAPAGQGRGLVPDAYDVSVKTKQYNQENDLLYQNQWNFFNIYQNEGVVVEGQKTTQSKKTSLE